MSNILQKQPLNGMTAVDEQYQINQTISPSGLEAVEYSLRNQFMASDWRLTGIEKTKHGIEVYVQIPTQLSVTDREFDHYVRHSVCPKQTDALWNEVRPSQLIIRLYTDVKSLASQTRCG